MNGTLIIFNLIMGILINPKGRSPSGHSVLEKQHLSNKMIVFQDALIFLIIKCQEKF